jgi:hypothetical protein
VPKKKGKKEEEYNKIMVVYKHRSDENIQKYKETRRNMIHPSQRG